MRLYLTAKLGQSTSPCPVILRSAIKDDFSNHLKIQVLLMSLKDHLGQEREFLYLKLTGIWPTIKVQITILTKGVNCRTPHANISCEGMSNVIFHHRKGWVPWLKYRVINRRQECVTLKACLNFWNMDGITSRRIESFPVYKDYQ